MPTASATPATCCSVRTPTAGWRTSGPTRDDVRFWAGQTTIVPRVDAHDAVSRLREQDDERDVLVYGSRTLWTDLPAHGLVDELHLMIGPRIVAGDHRAFAGLPETDLQLIGTRTWTGSGNVVLSYAVKRP